MGSEVNWVAGFLGSWHIIPTSDLGLGMSGPSRAIQDMERG